VPRARDTGHALACDENHASLALTNALHINLRLPLGAWGRLEFGDTSIVEISVQPGQPFVIGKNAQCDKVVVDEWVDARGQKGSRVSRCCCCACVSAVAGIFH